MIQSFRHKGLARFWNKGDARRINPDLRERVRERLTLLDTADNLRELTLPGLRPHPIGDDRYAIDVNGPWRITFEWEDGDAFRVDLEQYH